MAFAAVVLSLALAAEPQRGDRDDGVWLSRGYGYAIQVSGPELKVFEVTTTTCMPGLTARRRATAAAGATVFETSDGDAITIRPGGDSTSRVLHFEGSASSVRLDRASAVPSRCQHPPADTPADVFEVFTRTWAEHYISFARKGVTWPAVVAAHRARLAALATPTQLFELLEDMVGPLHDAHAFLEAPALGRVYAGLRPGTERLVKGDWKEFLRSGVPMLLAVTDRAYFKAPLKKWCNDQLQYGHVDAHTGYLRILSFSGYSTHGGFEGGRQALEAALDEVFSDATLQQLVIDVRLNDGGADPYGLAIASRLATGEYLAWTKEARANPVDPEVWTKGDPSLVRPSTRPGFRGPVVELTGPLTISAGETFTQALLGRVPRVIRVGEPTQGVFSDVLCRRLPNGWSFCLPNEVFRTPAGTTFDVDGIPPDVSVPVFAEADLEAGRDPGLARALELVALGRARSPR